MFLSHSGDFNLVLGIFILTVIISAFALANIVKFYGVWRRYRDFVSIVLIALPTLILIDELWSLYAQLAQLTHTDSGLLAHITTLRWARLIERSLAVIMLAVFVIWKDR